MNGRSHRDRSTRVTIFGGLALLCGASGMALGLLQLALPLIVPPSADAPGVDPAATVMGMLTWTELGVVLAIVGVGALRGRRWARPVMLVLAWTWLIAGAVAAAWTWWSAADLVVLATAAMDPPPPDSVMSLVALGLVGTTLVGGVLVPAAFVWAFRDEDVRLTLERRDPHRRWTDGRPLPLVGMAIALGLAALVLVPSALRPVMPAFGALLTGGVGAVATVAGSATCATLAAGVYRRRRWAWWGTTLAVAGLGVSTAWTLLRQGPLPIYRALGYPDEQLRAMAGSTLARADVLVAGTVALTLLSVAYMATIRRYFTGRAGA